MINVARQNEVEAVELLFHHGYEVHKDGKPVDRVENKKVIEELRRLDFKAAREFRRNPMILGGSA